MTAYHAGLIWMRFKVHPDEGGVPFHCKDHRCSCQLGLTDRAVLSALFSFSASDDAPRAFPSADKLAKRVGCDRRTVQRALDRLEELGLIVGEHRHRQPTIWQPSDAIHPRHASGTESLDSGTESPKRRQRVAQQTAQSRSASGTESHQGTEVTSRPKGRGSYFPSGAYGRSADAPHPPRPPHMPGLPAGVIPTITVTEN